VGERVWGQTRVRVRVCAERKQETRTRTLEDGIANCSSGVCVLLRTALGKSGQGGGSVCSAQVR
jgi:hypothetical protein